MPAPVRRLSQDPFTTAIPAPRQPIEPLRPLPLRPSSVPWHPPILIQPPAIFQPPRTAPPPPPRPTPPSPAPPATAPGNAAPTPNVEESSVY